MKHIIILLAALSLFMVGCNEPKEKKTRIRLLTVEVNDIEEGGLEVFIDGKYEIKKAANDNYEAKIDDKMHLVEVRAKNYQTQWFQVPANESLDPFIIKDVTLKREKMPVILESNPPGATVLLNNETVGETPVFIPQLDLGRHKVVYTFSDQANKPIKFTFELEKDDYNKIIMKEAISALGSVVIITDPGALVKVDGREIGTADENGRIKIEKLNEGKHIAEISKLYHVGVTHPFVCVRQAETPVKVRPMKMKTCSLVVESKPSGAKVYLDGQLQTQDTICQIDNLPPGEIDVKVELEGYIPKTETVNLTPAIKRKLKFELEHNSGSVSFITDPAGCEVYLGGKMVGVTKKSAANPEVSQLFVINKLKPGTYKLHIKHAGHDPFSTDFAVEFNKTTNLDPIKLKEKWIANYTLKLKTKPDVFEVKLISQDDKAIVVERMYGTRKNSKPTEFTYRREEVERLNPK